MPNISAPRFIVAGKTGVTVVVLGPKRGDSRVASAGSSQPN
jgi:hypothetical protein